MIISLADLRKMLNVLFDHAEKRGVLELEVPQNFYWHLPQQTVYDMTLPPTGLMPDIGSLADDWELQQGLVDGSREPLVVRFTSLAALLRVVGEVGGELTAKDGG